MILFIETLDGTRTHYIVNAIHDMIPVFQKYPQAQDAAMSATSLKEAVENVADYLASHNMDAWAEDPKLTKSLRHKAMALGLALGTTLMPQSVNYSPSSDRNIASVQEAKSPEDRFLWNIQQIESSGGQNTQHPEIQHGPAKGERAMGRWGLLKPTVQEIISRMQIDGTLSPEHRIMASMSRDEMANYFAKRPYVEKDMARYLARHVLKRQGGDHHKAAYAWLHGHNLSSRRITPSKLQSSDYIAKYKAADQLNPMKPKEVASDNMKKALSIEENFGNRLKVWFSKRNDQKNQPLSRDHSFVPDPGRIREESLDEKDMQPKDSYDKIRQQINKLNNGNS